MERTSNTYRVTFSANIGAGEGYLTEKAQDRLHCVHDFGWLWALDVLGDWRGEIERQQDLAVASRVGWFDKTSPNENIATSHQELARKMWVNGVLWPDLFCAMSYCDGADIDPKDMPYVVDDYASSDEFKEWAIERAKSDAAELAVNLRSNGVIYPHGNFPSYENLLQFFLLREFAGKGDDPLEKMRESPSGYGKAA